MEKGKVRIKRSHILFCVFFVALLGVLSLSYEAQPESAYNAVATIYIMSNGDVVPSNAPIQIVDTVYTLTDNVNSNLNNAIVIERNNTIFDGAAFTIQGAGITLSNGINLTRTNNVTIRNVFVRSFYYGIRLTVSTNDQIADSNVSNNNYYGIFLESSNFNTIKGNNITQNTWSGIWLFSSQNNNIAGNRLANSISSNFGGIGLQDFSDSNYIHDNYLTSNTKYGLYIENCGSNHIFHNNFIDNFIQAYADPYTSFASNSWDNGSASAGNYWNDYSTRYQYATETDSTGIWNTPYVVDSKNRDNYPLMNPWTPEETTVTVNGTVYPVTIVTNATIVSFDKTQDSLNFTVSGLSGQTAYVRVICPKSANSTTLRVYVNGTDTSPPFPLIEADDTCYFIYFEFGLSSDKILIPFAVDEYMFGTIAALASCFGAYCLLRRPMRAGSTKEKCR
jgi:parallel beta-helix repeat protein